ncbi:interferon-induced very large GTPase 1-like [Lampetra planeri]
MEQRHQKEADGADKKSEQPSSSKNANYRLSSSAEDGSKEENQEEDSYLSTKKIESVMTNKSDFHAILSKLNLTKYYPNKLTLRDVLTIDKVVFTGDESISMGNIAMHFLRNIMRANSKSRTTDIDSPESLRQDRSPDSSFLDELSPDTEAEADSVSILDLVAAVFLCCDSLLQQVLMMKMSRCHFALPLLLPDPGKGSVTFLLWAMRPVVHKWRPHSGEAIKGYREDSMATTPMPIISFVRLGDCSVSKSERINSVLSNENHEFFVHRAMECGDSCRSISKGMVEMCFYLPCGESQLDLFPDIFTVLNLRGDIRDHPHQLQVLKRTSDAMFIFVENVGDEECGFLSSNFYSNSTMFLAIDQRNRTDAKVLKKLRLLSNSLSLNQNNFCFMENRNEKKNKTTLQKTITDILKSKNSTRTLEKMATKVQQELNTEIDEYVDLCNKSKHSVDSILGNIRKSNLSEVKAIMMPCHGELWHKWAELSREQCRSKRRGDQTCEDYTREIEDRKLQLRQQQSGKGLSQAMETFASAILDLPEEMKMYFLQSMGMELDALSRQALFPLRGKYQELLKSTADVKEELKKLSNIMSSSSLGLENFMREIGQIYEASKVCKSENDHTRLPAAMAELFLKGVPMELLDGDAGCIPIDWITDVFAEVLKKLGRDPRVFVLTVLGVQSSGKSTLLNTMFGLQFAVGSGRCTRGAFMQLLPIDDDLKPELGFDFLLVIDTEGLKSSELAKLDNSHEHDNELATVVIGLSDLTLINLAMENAEEMKEILQVVVHAFLRMTVANKKPHCVFVHQNSGDVSAAENNMQAKKELLDQLNALTKSAAEMEHKQLYYKEFSDVIKYDLMQDNYFIPGLFHGSSCMASVSDGYSNKVYQLKKYLIRSSKEKNASECCCTISEWSRWINDLWRNVKNETYIFQFRNTLVVKAYNELNQKFSEWEWIFRKSMIDFLYSAELGIENASQETVDNVYQDLIKQATKEANDGKDMIIKHINDLFEQNLDCFKVVVKYKEDLCNSAKHLQRKFLDNTVDKCAECLSRKKSNAFLEKISTDCSQSISENVKKLLKKYEGKPLGNEQLRQEYDHIWLTSVPQMTTFTMKKHDIKLDMENSFRNNLNQHEGMVNAILSNSTTDSSNKGTFEVKNEHLASLSNKLLPTSRLVTDPQELRNISDELIEKCKTFVERKCNINTDYCPYYWDELLKNIDDLLNQQSDNKYNIKFIIDIKYYNCCIAIERFTSHHETFLNQNDPSIKLEEMKEKYFNNFTALYEAGNKKDKEGKLKWLTALIYKDCICPAVSKYLNKHLGEIILDHMNFVSYSQRKPLQLNALLQLLEEDDSSRYLHFLDDNDSFTKSWIEKKVLEYSKEKQRNMRHNICHLKYTIFSKMAKQIKASLINVEKDIRDGTLEGILYYINGKLEVKIQLDLKTVRGFLQPEETWDASTFSDELNQWLDRDMSAFGKCSDSCDIEGMLKVLSVKPHEEIFKVAAGCGKTCPLCGAPCDEIGPDHREHKATMHYPHALFKQQRNTCQLSTEVCTTSVAREATFWYFGRHTFKNSSTCWEDVEYNQYRTVNDYYSSWNIPAAADNEIPSFWKFVLCRHNVSLAAKRQLEPADIPFAWYFIKDVKQEVIQLFSG